MVSLVQSLPRVRVGSGYSPRRRSRRRLDGLVDRDRFLARSVATQEDFQPDFDAPRALAQFVMVPAQGVDFRVQFVYPHVQFGYPTVQGRL